MSRINIYCVDESGSDVVMWLDSFFTFGEIGITGVTDMVEKIERRCAGGDRLGELRIIGHGNALGQYVGAEWLSEQSLPNHRAALVRLAPLFAHATASTPGGLVTLGGCLVGHATGLMLRLSDIFNVPVRAFRASQRPLIPGDEGSEVQCYITCTRESRRGFDYLDW